jgi:hypothetical protein
LTSFSARDFLPVLSTSSMIIIPILAEECGRGL